MLASFSLSSLERLKGACVNGTDKNCQLREKQRKAKSENSLVHVECAVGLPSSFFLSVVALVLVEWRDMLLNK